MTFSKSLIAECWVTAAFINVILQPSLVSAAVSISLIALLGFYRMNEPKPIPREEIDKLANEVKIIKSQLGVLKMTFGMDGNRISMFSKDK